MNRDREFVQNFADAFTSNLQAVERKMSELKLMVFLILVLKLIVEINLNYLNYLSK